MRFAHNRGNPNPDDVMTIDMLSAAIQQRLHLDPPTARETAEYVLNFFGYEAEVVDNILLPEDRAVFYLLNDVGLLKTTQETTILASGRNWRIFYWQLNLDHIHSDSGMELNAVPDDSVYDMITTEQWFGH